MMDVNSIMFPGARAPDIQGVPIELVENEFPIVCHRGKNSTYTILFFHGNGETIQDGWNIWKSIFNSKESLYDLHIKANVVIPEYAGYGIRDGKETEKGSKQMAEKVFKWCYITLRKPVIVIGYSIGTGPATYIAKEYQKQTYGLVLVNPFKSIRDLAVEYTGFVGNFAKQRFANQEELKWFHGRLIIIAGEGDELIPFTHSISLHASAVSKNKKIIIYPNMKHGVDNWLRRVVNPVLEAWFVA